MQINWNNLEKNSDSKELSFESFNFQIAWIKFSHLGDFEYDYNTPGAEFFLTIKKDCPEIKLKCEDVVGWQAKFWVNHNDLNNTQMNSNRRNDLINGLQKALAQKPNLKTWIICTPGQIKTNARQKLENELHTIKSNLKINFWNKPKYETFYHSSHKRFNPIFAHYFSSQFIGYEFLKDYTQMRINRLEKKFDTDLYVSTSTDNDIESILDYSKIMTSLNSATHEWQKYIKFSESHRGQIISKMDNSDNRQICLSNLLKFLLKFSKEFHLKYYEYKETKNFINALNNVFRYVYEEISVLNNLIREINLCDKSDSDKERSFYRSMNNEIDSQFEFFDKIYDLYIKFYKNEIHVFGKAGYGKTNLACSICINNLKKEIPSILILASDIRVDSNISKWIVDSFQVNYDITTLMGFINNLGFLKQYKIPIVIDGLNEKYPDARIWQAELEYLRQLTKKFQNIVLITTSRESYVEEIFDKSSYKEVINNFYLEGFNQYNISIATSKYFEKYKIKIKNDDYDNSIFQNPLLLKIFCTVHEGKTFTLYHTNIYETMESYHKFLIDKIADSFPSQKSIMVNIIEDRIDKFCLKLLDDNSKSLNYKIDFFSIFDPNLEPSSQPKVVISDKILDEGMFVKREIVNKNEVVEFTHDFIGGFAIAKAIAFRNHNSQDILNRIQNNNVIGKVINLKTGEFSHPLSEDILKNLIYFYKKKTKGQLYEVLKFDSIIKLSLSMIEAANLNNTEKKYLINKLLSSENKDLIKSFFETVLSNITEKRDYRGIDILLGLIEKLSSIEIDLYWSEAIRKHSGKILKYLYDMEVSPLRSTDNLQEICYFISCLFSSTNRLLRDKATKVLVYIGENALDKVFAIYKSMQNVSDIYNRTDDSCIVWHNPADW